MTISRIKYTAYSLFVTSVCVLLVFISTPFVANAAPPPNPQEKEIYGWLWSGDTRGSSSGLPGGIGWVKLNSCEYNIATNTEENCIGVDYGVQVDTNDRLSGYAWSSNIGWIDFSGSGCGQQPKVSGNAIVGSNGGVAYARACSVYASGCSGAERPSFEAGGWDGCIKINGNNYGITVNPPNANGAQTLVGYIWNAIADALSGAGVGGTGWLKLRTVVMAPAAKTPLPPLVDLSLNNWTGACQAGNTPVTFAWTISNAENCTLTGPGVNYSIPNSQMPTGQKTFSIPQTTGSTYTLSCNNSNGSASDTVIASCSQCSDGVDNDGDGVIDNNDPSCYTNCSVSAGVYQPEFSNEVLVCIPPGLGTPRIPRFEER